MFRCSVFRIDAVPVFLVLLIAALKAQLAGTYKKATFTFYKNALRVSIKTTEVLKLEQYKENNLLSYALSLTHVNFFL